MSTAWIIQNQMARDVSGDLVQKFDFSGTDKFAYHQRFVLHQNAGPFQYNIMECIEEGLRDFDDTEDWLVLIGNPVLIGLCCALLSGRGKKLRLLQWDGRRREYLPLEFSI